MADEDTEKAEKLAAARKKVTTRFDLDIATMS
jgi:hypothetical protein